MTILRRLRRLPQETLFFLFLAVFAVVLAIAYWFVAYETAGTILLAGFGLAGGLISLRLFITRPVGGAEAVERPFLDETGRLPDETLAPLAVGLGVSICLTAAIFGPFLLALGVLPLAWGAYAWLAGARAELDATERADRPADGDRSDVGR